MAIDESKRIGQLLEALTGQRAPLSDAIDTLPPFPTDGLGYSQLNEMLLLLGYDRVTRAFFQFLANDSLEYESGGEIRSIDDLEAGVERSRQLSLLFFGNVKFGFKKLARDTDELLFYHSSTQRLDPDILKRRHKPIYPVDPIPSDQTYYLGYIVQKELDGLLKKDPENSQLLSQKKKLEQVREKGIRNQRAYLASDHLDVYVATSMRQRHEYLEVSEFARQVFSDDRISDLNLRWFDPTQAYCEDRIDKGLAEALMLKRAKCTLYLAQESDTLGKDSELASTLAQGKPVIAYVPSPTGENVQDYVKRLSELYSRPENLVILDRLQAMSPTLAWKNEQVRRWLDEPAKINKGQALEMLIKTTREHFDGRAKTLTESHPLGIQVNLDTGVANGVLVIRSAKDCAELIYRIVTRALEFQIEKRVINNSEYQFLRESVSNSVFRVMTGDAMLNNSFWNFYLEPAE